MAAQIRLSQQHSCSFNHLVGAARKRQWKGEPERPGGFEIDDQLDFCGLLNRKIGRFGSLENPARVNANASVCIGETGPVAHQAASFGELAPLIDRGYPMVRCQSNELTAPV